ncbi:hypothetical protein MHYP_G00111730 [Metynnis hypsauchen]
MGGDLPMQSSFPPESEGECSMEGERKSKRIDERKRKAIDENSAALSAQTLLLLVQSCKIQVWEKIQGFHPRHPYVSAFWTISTNYTPLTPLIMVHRFTSHFHCDALHWSSPNTSGCFKESK